MLDSILSNPDFNQLMKKNIQDMIVHFFNKEQNFGVLCKIDDAFFDPELPEEISKSFNPITLFFLAGYTFESANIQGDFLIFEAGFGADNFGSLVSIPLVSIMQIIVEETPLMINLATPPPKQKEPQNISSKGVESSMNSFLSNPENSKFLK